LSSQLKQSPLSLRSFNSAELNFLTTGERFLAKFAKGKGGFAGPATFLNSEKLVTCRCACSRASYNLASPTAAVSEVGLELELQVVYYSSIH
jgi:hypothetical protein